MKVSDNAFSSEAQTERPWIVNCAERFTLKFQSAMTAFFESRARLMS